MRTAAIFDLDGTLSDDSHRKHYAKSRDWEAYNSRLYQDVPNRAVLELLKATAAQGHRIILCTARDESFRSETLNWLSKYEIHEWDMLCMRPQGSKERDFVVKAEMYEQLRLHNDILFVVEDRQTVVDMWREKGLVVFQCAEGSY